MNHFRNALERIQGRSKSLPRRSWLFVPYDQLSDEVGPLCREEPSTLGILLVECPNKAERRPYHRQKLALVLTNIRHFALEQAARGVFVKHVVAPSYAAAVRAHAKDVGPLRMMRAAERELRMELAELIAEGLVIETPHEGWLTTREDFSASVGQPPWRMEAFYKHVRRRSGVLMQDGKPVGGRFSFDEENRRPWKGSPPAPKALRFEPDATTQEVCALVLQRMGHHPGTLDPYSLAASKADTDRLWSWAKRECLPHFGPFEDAMATASPSLFHTRVSPLLNLMRIPPARMVRDVLAMRSLPLPSKEGFIRQVLGWREYVRHVHETTDGLRLIHGRRQPCAHGPGDGGWGTWSGRTWSHGQGGDGGATTSSLGAKNPLPPAYWGACSGLNCLDSVVRTVWETGYSHHITRLMVLANIATLLDVSPRELTDWFWAAYVDAYDWVVEPNVHGMGVFGLGDLMTTKPYVAGATYIHRMSDYCDGCRFSPKTTCPLTSLYWAFLGRARDALADIPRMRLPLAAEAKRTAAQRCADKARFELVRDCLANGAELRLSEPPRAVKSRSPS